MGLHCIVAGVSVPTLAFECRLFACSEKVLFLDITRFLVAKYVSLFARCSDRVILDAQRYPIRWGLAPPIVARDHSSWLI